MFRADAITAGAGLVIIESEEGLSTALCESLALSPSVLSAGAISPEGAVELATTPGVLVQAASISPGIEQLWDLTFVQGGGRTGWIVGPALAEELDLAVGGTIGVDSPIGSELRSIVAVAPDIEVSSRSHRWLLEMMPSTGTAASCWVAFDRPVGPDEQLLMAALFSPTSDNLLIQPYLRPDALSRDVSAEIRGRPSQWGWVGFALVVLAMHRLNWQARRRERALYSILGTRRIDHFAKAQVEVTVLAAVPAALGACLAVAMWGAGDEAATIGFAPAGIALGTVLTGIAVVVAFVPLVAVPRSLGRLYTEVRSQQ